LIPVGVSVVITRSNFRNLVEIVRLARNVGAKAIHLSLARPVGRAKVATPPLVPIRELVDPYLIPVVKAAHADGLGVVFEGRSTDARWSTYFAGIGATDS
jgi:MoaA/NifB/PqqE/SkfB family radical SAM enzyme